MLNPFFSKFSFPKRKLPYIKFFLSTLNFLFLFLFFFFGSKQVNQTGLSNNSIIEIKGGGEGRLLFFMRGIGMFCYVLCGRRRRKERVSIIHNVNNDASQETLLCVGNSHQTWCINQFLKKTTTCPFHSSSFIMTNNDITILLGCISPITARILALL